MLLVPPAVARRARRFLTPLLACVVLIGVVACESKVTLSNFERIETGMSQAQVEAILGGKGTDETPSGTSITGAGLADSRAVKVRIYRWRDGSKHIVVTFKDGKVFEKVKEGL